MRIALAGAGAMGGALLSGWLASGHAAGDLFVVEPDTERAGQVAARYGVHVVRADEAAAADVVVLAVKPHLVEDALEEMGPHLRPGAVVVSIAAGVTLDRIERHLPEGVAAVRVMPNTPALVGEGMAGISPGSVATQEQVEQVCSLLDSVGRSVVVPEKSLDAVTALSGSGPAYLFYVAEAMIEAGVHQGLTRAEASELVNQTFVGVAALLSRTDRSATQLREMVTSPAGTTAAALRVLDERGVRAAFLAAAQACAERSRSLGNH